MSPSPVSASSSEHPFVGRRREIAQLRECLAQARAGHGGVVLVSGPAGIGKTSLLRWLEGEAEREGFVTRWGYCLPGVSEPFFAMAQLFPPTTMGQGPTHRARRSGRRRAPAPSLLQYLEALEARAVTHPLALLLDDFHWADPESVQTLRLLGRNVRRHPVLMAVALREEEVENPSLREVLRDLRREGLARDLALSGFRELEARDLLETVIHAPLDTQRIRTALRSLLTHTGGNPYFLLETARQLQDEGNFRSEEGQGILEVGSEPMGRTPPNVPASIGTILDHTLQILPAEERAVLECAALVGPEFDTDALVVVLGRPVAAVLMSLRHLVEERKLVHPLEGQRGRYAFSHILLQERTRAGIPPDRRREWIGRLLQWWKEQRPPASGQIFALCRETDRFAMGRTACEQAIATALETHGHERAAALAHPMIDWMVDRREPRTRIAEWGLRVLDQLRSDGAAGRWTEPLCQKLLGLNPPPPLRWELLLRLSGIIAERVPEARKTLDQVRSEIRVSRAPVSPGLDGTVALMESVILYNEGQTRAAEAAALRALERLPTSRVFFRGLALHRLGWIEAEQCRWDAAQHRTQEGLMLAKSSRLWGLIPYFLLMQGQVASVQGKLQTAQQVFEETASVCRDLGRMNWLSITLSDLSLVLGNRGDLPGAEATAREALRVAETFGAPGEIGPSLLQLSRIKLLEGLPAEAMEILRRAQRAYEAHGRSTEVVDLRMHLAEVRHALGDPKGALAELRNLSDPHLKEEQGARLHLLRSRFLLARGERVRARQEAELSLAEAESRGLAYSQAEALAALAEWERRYGTPERAHHLQQRSERMFDACGVLPGFRSLPRSPGPSLNPRLGGSDLAVRSPLAFRLLQHLAGNGALEGTLGPRDVAPFALTQKGIALGLGLPRDRFSMVLKRLVDRGLVSARQHYVQGAVRRMKIYLLTDSGARLIVV